MINVGMGELGALLFILSFFSLRPESDIFISVLRANWLNIKLQHCNKEKRLVDDLKLQSVNEKHDLEETFAELWIFVCGGRHIEHTGLLFYLCILFGHRQKETVCFSSCWCWQRHIVISFPSSVSLTSLVASGYQESRWDHMLKQLLLLLGPGEGGANVSSDLRPDAVDPQSRSLQFFLELLRLGELGRSHPIRLRRWWCVRKWEETPAGKILTFPTSAAGIKIAMYEKWKDSSRARRWKWWLLGEP